MKHRDIRKTKNVAHILYMVITNFTIDILYLYRWCAMCI